MWLVLLGACARPVVEDDQPDAAQNLGDGQSPEEDAEEPQPGQDAGGEVDSGGADPADAGEPEAGCADTDMDTVCDADDNCPEQSNTNQADADDDGIGDACDQPASSDAGSGCKTDTVPASVTAGSATLSEVRVNGGGSTASVSKGQTLSISMHYAFAACGSLPIPAPRSIVLGVEGQPDGDCTLLLEVPCPQAVSANTTLTIQAPSRAGPAYLVAVGREAFTCSNSLTGAQRIAALCVQ